jgi:hypothetical protein
VFPFVITEKGHSIFIIVMSEPPITICVISAIGLPRLVVIAGERASLRFLEFCAANIRNPHSRRGLFPGGRGILGLVR